MDGPETPRVKREEAIGAWETYINYVTNSPFTCLENDEIKEKATDRAGMMRKRVDVSSGIGQN